MTITGYTTCKEHRWPRNVDAVMRRGDALHEISCCIDCHAFKIVWVLDVCVDGTWVRTEETKIVEPDESLMRSIAIESAQT